MQLCRAQDPPEQLLQCPMGSLAKDCLLMCHGPARTTTIKQAAGKGTDKLLILHLIVGIHTKPLQRQGRAGQGRGSSGERGQSPWVGALAWAPELLVLSLSLPSEKCGDYLCPLFPHELLT